MLLPDCSWHSLKNGENKAYVFTDMILTACSEILSLIRAEFTHSAFVYISLTRASLTPIMYIHRQHAQSKCRHMHQNGFH